MLLHMGNCGRSLLECSYYVDAIKVPFIPVRGSGLCRRQGVDAQGWQRGRHRSRLAEHAIDKLQQRLLSLNRNAPELKAAKYLSDDEYEEQIPSSAWHTTMRPYCLARVTFSWVTWSDEPGLSATRTA